MNAYINFVPDEKLYAILQALTPLCQDLKEEIMFKLCILIQEEYYSYYHATLQ